MNLKLLDSKNDFVKFSRLFLAKNQTNFQRSKSLFMDFNISGKKDIIKMRVFYSKKNKIFMTKFNNRDIIRFAFGRYSQLTFKLAGSETNPLKPFIVFNFPLNNTPQPFEAIYALNDGKFHILLKIFDLEDGDLELLNHFYNVYKIEEEDYALFDFGDFRKKDFLHNLAKITEELNFTLNENNKVVFDDESLNRVVERLEKYNATHCSICGKKIKKLHFNLNEISKRFPRKCESCLTKIYVLDLYYELNDENSENNMIYLSELENLWGEKGLFNYNMNLLKHFKFLKPFHDDIYKLIPNEEIIDEYSYLFKSNDKIEEDTDVLSDIEALLGLNDENGEAECRICGTPIGDESYFGSDICSECLRKQEAIEQIHKLLLYVKPSSAFTKSSLISKGLNSYDLEIIISLLLEYNLIYDDFDDLLILESKSVLNEFIIKYSENEGDIIPEDVEEVKKLTISRDCLTEDSIDKVINLMNYRHFVEITYARELDEWEVLFKKYGMANVVHIFDNPFEAKLSAVEYLESIHLIEIIDEVSSGVEDGVSTVAVEEVPTTPELGDDLNSCPICDSLTSNPNKTYCEECLKKYNTLERQALLGIKNGKYDKNMALEMQSLLNQDNSKTSIAREYKLKNIGLIEPIIKFLLGDYDFPFEIENDECDTISESDDKEDLDLPSCPICGASTSNPNKNYCDSCVENYTSNERQALLGIKKGKYDKKMALEMRSLLNQDFSKSSIANKYKLKSPGLIEPIIKFLLGDYDLPFEVNIKLCPICEKPVSRPTKTYCDECIEKYTSPERRALVGIKEGIYTKDLARKMLELKKQGKKNSYITKKLNFPDANTPSATSLINPIIKFALKDELDEETLKSLESKKKEKKVEESQKKEKTNICVLCEEEFIPKSLNRSDKYCPKCKKQYKEDLNIVLGVKEGEYTKELAKEFIKLQNEGLKNKEIGKQFGIPPSYVNKIIEHFLEEIAFDEQNESSLAEILEVEFPNDLKGPLQYGLGEKIKKFNSNNGIIIFGYHQQWYIYDIRGKNRKLIKIFNSQTEAFEFWENYDASSSNDKTPKKAVYVYNESIILNGNILMEEYSSLLSLISSMDCNIRKFESNKEDDYYAIFLDLGLDNNEIPNILINLEKLGWRIVE